MGWFFDLEVFALYFLGLWIAYANLMVLKNNYEDKFPEWLKKLLTYGLGVPFILLDVLFNVIYGTLMYLELPDFKNCHWKYLPTFTERCSRHLHAEWSRPSKTWRFKLAWFICHYMLEPWDYNHCGLAKLKNGIHA